MRAIVVLYEGKKLSESCQTSIGELVAQKTNASSVKINTLNNEEVEKITAASLVKFVTSETPIIDSEEDVFKKSIDILGDALNGEDSIDIVATLLKKNLDPLLPTCEKQAIKNAIIVIGEYNLPSILIANYGITRQAIKACQSLCKSNLF